MGARIAYPGSKNGSGVCERLISAMPAHKVYVAAFAGHDAIYFRKRPAQRSYLIDRDEAVWRWWQSQHRQDVHALCGSFLELASSMTMLQDRTTFLYVDPPYLRSTRGMKTLWKHDMDDEASHQRLLSILKGLCCMVMLSGYPSDLYSSQLQEWRCETYRVMTRGGPRTEAMWMNYPAGQYLHDCRYVGGTFRGRERLKRRCSRWVSRFQAMPPAERQVIWESLRVEMLPGCADPHAIGGDADRHAGSDDARGPLGEIGDIRDFGGTRTRGDCEGGGAVR